MNHRVLTQEQIDEAKELRRRNSKYYTLNRLAQMYEVGKTTIGENINPRKRADRREYFKVYFRVRIKPQKSVCNPCAVCTICMTRIFEDNQIPVNYQVGNTCISCYMESIGLRYINLLEA
jgi:hypothetical protein